MSKIFLNRRDAGRKLALLLKRHIGPDSIIYALPRGGVIVAAEISKLLRLPMDLIIVSKIRHPEDPELAIGAIAEDAEPLLDPAASSTVDPAWLAIEAGDRKSEILRRKKLYLDKRKARDPRGKSAIIVDDGLATGLTMLSAISWLREKKPAEIMVAVAVSSPGAAREVSAQADRFISFYTPELFIGGVSNYYREFDQTSDKEVKSVIRNSSVI